ncbi:RlpA-like double-psi beta-barrel-protein domain-containing protein-containing protein [Mycena filopes]|nr:RlpA-like double-psi beta-barrel-protein domain-containing protein-containing protein [Mycena filopes]
MCHKWKFQKNCFTFPPRPRGATLCSERARVPEVPTGTACVIVPGRLPCSSAMPYPRGIILNTALFNNSRWFVCFPPAMTSAILLLLVLGLVQTSRAANWNRTLDKRVSDARFTFFDAGLGACGGTNDGSDFIVALNAEQYGNGEHCYKTIEITYNGKTAHAQVVDECPDCPYGALDFSRALFDHFASEDLGVIYGSWVFGDSTQKPTTTAKKTTTTKHTTTRQETIRTTGTSTGAD